ncbi:MAG: hypothetical protein QM742_19080 [Aquabacterium sp.]
MFASLLPTHCLPHVPVFPPLPSDQEHEPAGGKVGPWPKYCPTRPRRATWGRMWMAQASQGSPGAVSVGHGIGSPGNEGTARDRGTGAPGSNLTADDHTAPADVSSSATDADRQKADKGLMEGTKKGPAQPS